MASVTDPLQLKAQAVSLLDLIQKEYGIDKDYGEATYAITVGYPATFHAFVNEVNGDLGAWLLAELKQATPATIAALIKEVEKKVSKMEQLLRGFELARLKLPMTAAQLRETPAYTKFADLLAQYAKECYEQRKYAAKKDMDLLKFYLYPLITSEK
jgi:hypothetical protein